MHSHILNIIMEEDESPSPLLSVKARRRHANIATININRDDDTFLRPRPAPRPDSTPQSSPDSLNLTFTDLAKFPCPPSAFNLFTPTLSTSDLSSSPGAHSSGVPLTPSTSDDEFLLPSPRFNPRRAAMQPLVITKNHLRPFKKSPSSFMALADDDSDPESDSEWYNHEFSQLISLRSPVSSSFPSRPDSMSIPSHLVFSPTPASKRRVSGSKPNDTVHPRRRSSKSRSVMIPKYPPPPVPPVPEHLRSPPTASSPFPSPCMMPLIEVQRPPPRSSIPADCVFDLYMDGSEEGDAESDGSSDFSFSMYEIDLGERRRVAASPASVYSQPSLDEVKFELDYQLMLPLSIPGTPIDLEADIMMGFEKLREQAAEDVEHSLSVIEGKKSEPVECPKEAPPSSISSSFSFSPSPSLDAAPCEERVLRSKWSSSTLGSIHDEHGHSRSRSASSRLRLYFGGASHSTKRTSKNHSLPRTPPQSPFTLKSPSSSFSSSSAKKAKASHSPALSPPLTRWPAHKRGSSTVNHHNNSSKNNNQSDVIVIGYGVNGTGLKRRGSTATVLSDAGSEDSTSSSSSSGLRRKPIPIEMFLRNAA